MTVENSADTPRIPTSPAGFDAPCVHAVWRYVSDEFHHHPAMAPDDAPMRCAECGAAGPGAASTPAPDPRLVALAEFFRSIGALCRRSIESTKGRRAYIRMEIKGHHIGHSVEVYPGVRGWYLDHGRRATMVGGKLVDQPITAVKVCARTMLEAVEHGINRLPVAMRAAARGE